MVSNCRELSVLRLRMSSSLSCFIYTDVESNLYLLALIISTPLHGTKCRRKNVKLSLVNTWRPIAENLSCLERMTIIYKIMYTFEKKIKCIFILTYKTKLYRKSIITAKNIKSCIQFKTQTITMNSRI